jgi:transposase
MEKVYIGMDVHSKSNYVVVQNAAGDVIKEGSIPATSEEIKAFLMGIGNGRMPEDAKIGFESGQQAMWMSKYIGSLGMEPIIIDAREVRRKTRRDGQKSDRRDAYEICDGIRRGIYSSIVYVPEDRILKLRSILMRRRHFVRVCTGEINAAKYQLRAVGLSTSSVPLDTETGWKKMLKKFEQEPFIDYSVMHSEVWKMAAGKIKELEAELREALEPFKEVLEILTSVPGVGLLTAATYIAVIATPKRFPDSSRVVSYAGLATSTYDSGETERHGHITRRGSAELRSMLCEAAQQARNPRNPLNPFFVRVCAKSGYKRAIISVAHRLARVLYQMWKRMERFDARKLNLECGEYQKIRKSYYRIKDKKAV